MEITKLLQQMKEADERTNKIKKSKPIKSGLTNKQKYLRGLM